MSAVWALPWGSHAWSTTLILLWACSEAKQQVESWCRSVWKVWSRLCSIWVLFYPMSFFPLSLFMPACLCKLLASLRPSSAFHLLPACDYLLPSSNTPSMSQILSSYHLTNASHLCRDEPLHTSWSRSSDAVWWPASSSLWNQPCSKKPSRTPVWGQYLAQQQ